MTDDEPWLMAKRPVLLYWCAPGLDEIKLYDRALALGLDARLYPNLDQCDVSVGGAELGIDVKAYTSPITLAKKLDKEIGKLKLYRHRILAISDAVLAANPNFLKMLAHDLSPETKKMIELKSVSQVMSVLEQYSREARREKT